ncbi:MAG: hypothetical protein KDA96_06245, partial [Planctomycetaceae bacterium]|nr:hypothetical protein [Planctomycetaceae bacterium]
MTSPIISALPRGYRIDRHYGLVYDRVPSAADDLTVIHGIRTREAVVLNRLGVYFLGQIAMWQHHEIAIFSEELRVSPATIQEEQWVQQARSLMDPVKHVDAPRELPASLTKTIMLLTAALMIGFFLVYLLRRDGSTPMQGILSAEITSLTVPVNSRLVSTNVRTGDEIFSGEQLLTLEKSEHLDLLEAQQRRVHETQQLLRQAEARAQIELESRIRETEGRLIRVRMELQKLTGSGGAAPVAEAESNFRNVSSTRAESLPATHHSMRFFNGVRTRHDSETSMTAEVIPSPRAAEPRPVSTAPLRTAPASETIEQNAISAQVAAMMAELNRLEEFRTLLPDTVRQAAGIDDLQSQAQQASERFEQMKAVSRNVPVVSPAYGIVGQLRFKEGDLMEQGEVMLKILHTDRRHIVV